jgi:DNA-binding beta-propeller fold protein YncE
MKSKRLYLALIFAVSTLGTYLTVSHAQVSTRIEGAVNGPKYSVDPFWPKPLPNNWILGQVSGVAVDAKDNVWIIHRPLTVSDDEKGATLTPKRSKCCVAAPPVLQFDRQGNLLKAWGGAGEGFNWPKNEHGIYIDPQNNVWLGGNDASDHMILKFTVEGKFLLQIGSPGKSLGSNSPTQLGRPAHMNMDVPANEIYVADGYLNKRVIVFDASTGAYKRHWGAYGSVPSDQDMPSFNPNSPQFSNPVHCVRLMKDNTLYVCDRANNRIQVFEKTGKFIKQMVFEAETKGSGSVWDLIPTDDAQKYILIADGTNNEVHIALKETGERIGSFGRSGRNAGDFHWVHNIAVDSQGSVYTTEVDNGKRAQKFVLQR